MKGSKIEDYRKKIDSIDKKVLELLNRRAKIAIKIGEIKKINKIKVKAPERERKILENLKKIKSGPFSDQAIQKIFKTIIIESRKLQSDLK